MFTYRTTHQSKTDDSPAMMVCENPFVLVNEDGFAWADDPEGWQAV